MRSKILKVVKIGLLIFLGLLIGFLLFQTMNLMRLAYTLNRPHAIWGAYFTLELSFFVSIFFFLILSFLLKKKRTKWIIRIVGIGLFLASFLLIPVFSHQFDLIENKIQSGDGLPGYKPELLVSLGYDAWENGDLDKAMEYYNEAIRVYEYAGDKYASPDPYNNMAWIYATEKNSKYYNPKKAIEVAMIAVNISKWTDASAIDTLATAYASNEDFKSAYETELKALNLQPDREDYQKMVQKYKQLSKS